MVPVIALSRSPKRASRSHHCDRVASCRWVAWRSSASSVGGSSARLGDAAWNEGRRVLARERPCSFGERPSPSRASAATRSRLEEVGDRLVLSTLASEDRGWDDHAGVDR